MEVGFVKSHGYLTIPYKFRKRYGIKPGTLLNIFEEEDGIKIIPITPQLIEKNKGFMKGKESLLKELLRKKKIEREL